MRKRLVASDNSVTTAPETLDPASRAARAQASAVVAVSTALESPTVPEYAKPPAREPKISSAIWARYPDN